MIRIKMKNSALLVNEEHMLSCVITQDPEMRYRYTVVFNMAAGLSHRVDWETAATPYEAARIALYMKFEKAENLALFELIEKAKTGDAAALSDLSDGGLCIDEDDFKELYC